MASKNTKKAIELLTLATYPDLKTKFLKRYIVIANSTAHAVSMIQLKKGEQLIEAKELLHEVVMK